MMNNSIDELNLLTYMKEYDNCTFYMDSRFGIQRISANACGYT